MKMKKKLFATVLLSLAMTVLLVLGLTACGGEQTDPGNTLPYSFTLTEDGTGYELSFVHTKYDDTGEDSFTIPSTYEGLPVVSIGAEVFNGSKYYKTIHIPDTVKTIKDSAFINCEKLESIVIPDSVTTLGDGVFKFCASLTEVTMGSGITEIPDFSFEQCTSLAKITYRGEIKKIGFMAFGETGFEEMILPDTLEEIGELAFSGTPLKRLVVPDSVTKINEGALSNVLELTELTIPFIGTQADGQGDNTFISIFRQDYLGIQSLKTVTVTGGTAVADRAFLDCDSIAFISLPNTIETIGEQAFGNCSDLLHINIPKNVTAIGNGAFANCYTLVEIHDQSVALDIQGASDDELGGIRAYAKHIYEEGESRLLILDDGLVIYHHGIDNIIVGRMTTDKKLVIPKELDLSAHDPEFVFRVDDYAMHPYAFYDDDCLEEVETPMTAERAFCGCVSLKKVTMQSQDYESIGTSGSISKGAFQSCAALTEVIIDENVAFIAAEAFDNSHSLERVVFENTQNWKAGDTEIAPEQLTPENAAKTLLAYCRETWTQED